MINSWLLIILNTENGKLPRLSVNSNITYQFYLTTQFPIYRRKTREKFRNILTIWWPFQVQSAMLLSTLMVSQCRKHALFSMMIRFVTPTFDVRRYSSEILPRGWRKDESSSILSAHLESRDANKVHSRPYRRKAWRRWSAQVWVPFSAYENRLRHWNDCNRLYHSVKWKWIHPCGYLELQVLPWRRDRWGRGSRRGEMMKNIRCQFEEAYEHNLYYLGRDWVNSEIWCDLDFSK